MKALQEMILSQGKVINNEIIKVDSFLNHQIDVELISDLAAHIIKHFQDKKIDKVLTIETSGIAIAYAVAYDLKVPLVFAKKSKSAIVGDDVFTTEIKSFTRNTVSKVTVSNKYLKEGENILLVDDFLAEGNAGVGLIDLCKQAKANIVGLAVAIEKGFQGGRKRLEDAGVKVYSAANIKAFKDNKPIFE